MSIAKANITIELQILNASLFVLVSWIPVKAFNIENTDNKNEIDKIKVTEADKKDFYEKNKEKFVEPETFEASHILVKTEAEAKAIISQLDKAPNKVEKFKELSKILKEKDL